MAGEAAVAGSWYNEAVTIKEREWDPLTAPQKVVAVIGGLLAAFAALIAFLLLLGVLGAFR